MDFADVWLAARTRVLRRQAEQAAQNAAGQRQRADHPPDCADPARWAESHQQLAAELERYAADCLAAAEDPSLPTPEYAGQKPGAAS